MDDLEQLRVLAGIRSSNLLKPYSVQEVSGSSKGEYMKQNSIRPGTDEWFKLWFARPTMTGENPTPKR